MGRSDGGPTHGVSQRQSGGRSERYLFVSSQAQLETGAVRGAELALCSTPRPEAPADWTEEEFGTVQFFDERLKQRLFTLAADFFAQPGELVPQVSNGSAAKTKAAYRFFKNSNVDMQTCLDRTSSQPLNGSARTRSSWPYKTPPRSTIRGTRPRG